MNSTVTVISTNTGDDIVKAVKEADDHTYMKVFEIILERVDAECQFLCSTSKFESVLRRHGKDDIMNFSWQVMIDEWTKHAPFLHAILNMIVGGVKTRNLAKGATVEARYPSICAAGAILLKKRCTHMSLLHHLVGVLLYHGDVKKTVSLHAL